MDKMDLAAMHFFVKQAAGTTDIASDVATHSQWDNLKKDWFNLKGQVGAAGALLTGQMTPHMGPILINAPHQELDKVHYNPNIPGMGMNMDELYETSKYVQHNYYKDTVKDQLLLKGGGELVGLALTFKGLGALGPTASEAPELEAGGEELSTL